MKDCKDVRISTISTASTEHIYAEIEKTDLTPSHSTTSHLGTFSTLKKQTLKKKPTDDNTTNWDNSKHWMLYWQKINK